MPLIQCPDCGKEVSTLAPACPHCGRPVEKQPAAIPDGLGVVCPDRICTGTLNVGGKCEKCGKSAGWKEDEEQYVGYTATTGGVKSPANKFIGCILGLIVILLLLKLVGQQGCGVKTTTAPITVDKYSALGLVSLEDYRWRKKGFGNVLEADFTIKNESDYDVKDVELTCTIYAQGGTVLDKNKKMIYEVIEKHGSERRRKFNLGFIDSQTYHTTCEVTNLSLVP